MASAVASDKPMEAMEAGMDEPLDAGMEALDPGIVQQVEEEYKLSDEQVESEDVLCEAFYLAKGNCKKVLLAMCFGLATEDGSRKLADLESEPYSSLSKTRCHPNLQIYRQEIVRRCRAVGVKPPRCSNYSKGRCVTWLLENPVKAEDCVSFLLQIKDEYWSIQNAAATEKAEIAKDKLRTANWCSNKPFLRLYCCMVHDKAREALLRKDDCLTRCQLDAGRSSYERPKTFEEIVAAIYNDEDFVPVTESLPTLHVFFGDTIELPFSNMPGGEIDAEEVKCRYTDCRAKLIVMVKDWEKSGNGFGQRARDSDDYGRFSEAHVTELAEGDNQGSFMLTRDGHREHHLYLWHLANTMGVLSNVLTVLSKAVAADGDSAPTDCSSSRKKRKKQEEGATQFQHSITSSLAYIAVSAKERRLYFVSKRRTKTIC